MNKRYPYAKGRNDFAEWLKNAGIRKISTTDRGLQKDDSGWQHFAYTVTVSNSRHAGDDDAVSYDFPYMQGVAHTKPPTLVDLIASLFSDAACVLDRSFDDFCSDLGYDNDSRKAADLYAQIQVNNGRLLRLFRRTDLSVLLSESEAMREAAGIL